MKNEAIPEWAEGLYYNKGLFSEVLVYHDDESIYFEHRGKESGIVRFTFEMIEGLKIVEDEGEEQADSGGVRSPTPEGRQRLIKASTERGIQCGTPSVFVHLL